MSQVFLIGGWGYDNLGDEMILEGYLRYFEEQSVDVEILSASPSRTAAFRDSTQGLIRSERSLCSYSRKAANDCTVLVCGGGYLNGTWVPEGYLKLALIRLATLRYRCVIHGVEVRGLADGPAKKMLRAIAGIASGISVRDSESKQEIGKVHTGAAEVKIVPDAISLLYGRSLLDSSGPGFADMSGYTLVNLMNVANRPDSKEAEFCPSEWRQYVDNLLSELRGEVVGLVIGDQDYSFLRSYRDIPLFRPSSATQFLSAIASAKGIVSTRMHPALIASQLGTPCVSIPYCGKVRPTHRKLGIDEQVIGDLDLKSTMDGLSKIRDHHRQWRVNRRESEAWLSAMLSLELDSVGQNARGISEVVLERSE